MDNYFGVGYSGSDDWHARHGSLSNPVSRIRNNGNRFDRPWLGPSLDCHFLARQAIHGGCGYTQRHQLVRTGIYKVLRHPSYAGSLLSFLGLGLAFSNYLSVTTIFVPICGAFLYRIHVEEKTLIATFGDEYLNYRASTKGLVPNDKR